MINRNQTLGDNSLHCNTSPIILSNYNDDPSRIKQDLDKQGFYVRRAFVENDLLAALCAEATKGPSRRTNLGREEHECWTEHGIRAKGLLSEILTGSQAQQLVQAGIGLRAWTTEMWVHHYASGERIPWHRDAAGDLQLVLCLLAPPAINGGLLLLRHSKNAVAVDLRPGDAVLFTAAKTLHATTRLMPTRELPNPERMVAVVRFYGV